MKYILTKSHCGELPYEVQLNIATFRQKVSTKFNTKIWNYSINLTGNTTKSASLQGY